MTAPRIATGLALLLAALPGGRAAATEADPPQIHVDREVGATRNLRLEIGQNRLLVLSEQIVRVSVADPRIADLKVITPTQLLLTAKGVGSTDLSLWNRKDEPLVLALDVTRSLRLLHSEDPLRYDFALCHLGIAGDCPRKRNLQKCARCPIVAICQL